MTENNSLLDPNELYSKYEILEELGKGVHANVFKCINKNNGNFYALKKIKHIRLKTKREEFEEAIMKEISILRRTKHNGIVNLIEAFKIQTEIVVILEYLSGGELFEYISKKCMINEAEANVFSIQILKALSYLHKNKIVHLDLKPENIMLRNKNSLQIVIVDFSISQEIKPNQKIIALKGTPEFIAPEVINYDSVGFFTDMWAFGVILYILLTGCSPFLGENEIETLNLVTKAEVVYDIEEFQTISTPAINMIKSLIKKDKTKRLTADECLSHEWIRNPRSLYRRSSSIGTKNLARYVSVSRWKDAISRVKTTLGVPESLKKNDESTKLSNQNIEVHLYSGYIHTYLLFRRILINWLPVNILELILFSLK